MATVGPDGTSEIEVRSSLDVERARRAAREVARGVGLPADDAERVALAVSELAANLVRYAVGGRILLAPGVGPRGRGVRIESADDGPGIPDMARALEDGYSSGGGLGGGLPGVRRLMDEFQISSTPRGTTVVAHKWPSPGSR